MLDRKRFLTLGLAGGAFAALSACSKPEVSKQATDGSSKNESEQVEVHIGALKGPTAMGLVKFMDDVAQDSANDQMYQFEIMSSPDEVAPKISQGALDIACIPANLGAVLYNKTKGAVQTGCINTGGVLYLVGRGSALDDLSALTGTTIYSAGKGAVPEYVLKYVLTQAGLDVDKDVTIEWKSEHAECVSALAAHEGAVALLPEPFVTTARMKDSSLQVVYDINTAWKDATNTDLCTGITIVRKEFAEAHPTVIQAFFSHYGESVKYVSEHTEEAAKLIGEQDIVPEKVAREALPKCGICYVNNDEMKFQLSTYLKVLFDQNPKSVGGKLPEDDFYLKLDA